MKLLIPFLILVFVFQISFAQAPDPGFIEKIAFQDAKSFLKSGRFIESNGIADTDLTYQRLKLSVDPAVNYISGSVFSILKFKKDQIGQVVFDLTSVLTVDSVFLEGQKIVFQHQSNKITVALPKPMTKESNVSVEVFYRGAPANTAFGSFTISKHNNVPVLWTLSEPYGAMDWWPCKESLADKIDSIDIFVTNPSQYRAASNGKLISDVVSGTSRTAHWKHRYPIATYLVAIAVTNYETYSDFLNLPDGRKIEILNYIYPEYLEIAKTKSIEILSIMDFFNRKFITYPFASEKYGHAQFGWGGGMEHQTMSFMTNLDFDLVAHEMAHQWFGNYITLASWHDIWLNEGFATYLTGLAYENLQNGVWWPAYKDWILKSVTSKPGGSVYVADTSNVPRLFDSRLSYNKGSSLLHMLRWHTGDEKFFRGMKNYLTDPTIVNGFASHNTFVKHMEMVADTSFTEYFNDWYYGEGYPVYTLTYFPDPVNPAKQKLRVRQTPSHESVAFFEMMLPIRVWKGDKYRDLRLHHTSQDQEFTISDQPFDKIEFDPDKWLIAKVDAIVSAKQLAENQEIRIIPENSSGKVRVILPDFSGTETFRLIDLSGKTIQSGMLTARNSGINFHAPAKGIYVVEIQTKGGSKTSKIVVR